MNSVQNKTVFPICVCNNCSVGIKKAYECEKCYLNFFGGTPLRPGLLPGQSHLVYNFMFEDVIYSCIVTLVRRSNDFDTLNCKIQNLPGLTDSDTSLQNHRRHARALTLSSTVWLKNGYDLK